MAMQLSPGRHGLSREAVAASQRGRILEAMVDAVAKRGYPDTRVVDVIARAGVSRKTFYELFEDKEGCFLAAHDDVSGRLFSASSQGFDSAADQPWATRVRAGVAALLGFLAEDPRAARFVIVEVFAAGPKALARRDAALRRFTHFIDAGRAESSRELPGITATAIIGGVHELLCTEIRQGATEQLPDRLPEIVFWITLPFLGPAGAAEERNRAGGRIAERT